MFVILHSLGWGLVLLKVLNTCLLVGSRELILWFSFLVCTAFALLSKLTHQFSSFYPRGSSLLQLVGE